MAKMRYFPRYPGPAQSRPATFWHSDQIPQPGSSPSSRRGGLYTRARCCFRQVQVGLLHPVSDGLELGKAPGRAAVVPGQTELNAAVGAGKGSCTASWAGSVQPERQASSQAYIAA